MTDDERISNERLVHAYNRMMQRVKAAIDKAEKEALPALEKNVEAAKEKAVELGEISREEAERIGDYLKRDLEDAAGFVADTGKKIGDWLRFDLELVEDRLLDVFSSMVDHTKMELDRIAERASKIGEWHTGEVTGVGTLRCKGCGKELHFHATGHVPPCPKCHGTKFTRVSRED